MKLIFVYISLDKEISGRRIVVGPRKSVILYYLPMDEAINRSAFDTVSINTNRQFSMILHVLTYDRI